MTRFTFKEKHYLTQAYYKLTLKEMLKLTNVEFNKMFDDIPENIKQHFLDN